MAGTYANNATPYKVIIFEINGFSVFATGCFGAVGDNFFFYEYALNLIKQYSHDEANAPEPYAVLLGAPENDKGSCRRDWTNSTLHAVIGAW